MAENLRKCVISRSIDDWNIEFCWAKRNVQKKCFMSTLQPTYGLCKEINSRTHEGKEAASEDLVEWMIICSIKCRLHKGRTLQEALVNAKHTLIACRGGLKGPTGKSTKASNLPEISSPKIASKESS
ncbi:unnamed protein product [Dovyalis caffra]|uniref:Uncharacterized protein n=1 Tax=Dovyalis caffra TaxID=77055 RepID=A0AAV1RZS4_9ROSI|nr:unnamed protein product [Dovyalis caffra]